MKTSQVTQENFLEVLENIKKHYITNEAPDNWDREAWVDAFNEMLDELLYQDFFGTEGQLDPRGDQRN